MRAIPITITTILLLLSISSAPQKAEANVWPLLNAARCIAQSKKCPAKHARHVRACRARKQATAQNFPCQLQACSYCKLYGTHKEFPCQERKLRQLCRHVFRRRRKHLYRASCIWTARRTAIVIDLGRVREAHGWSPIARAGLSGLIYESHKNLGIDPPGQRGKMCFRVRARRDGDYYFSAVSFAPHGTEHNDVWVRSSMGFGLWQGNKWRDAGRREWLKAYQNKGFSGISHELRTKDHDGHTFVVHGVRAGRTFKICISGRSYRYEIFRLVLVKCRGFSCRGGIIPGIRNIKPSVCLRH